MSVTGEDRIAPPTGERVARLSSERQALLDRWLARAEAARTPAGPRPITARPPGSRPPLSSAQARMWFLEQYAPGTSTYTMWMPMRLGGVLDVDALRTALRTVVARHESLRMRFPVGPDGVPSVDIAEPADVPMRVLDVSDAIDGADPADTARRLLEREVAQPFDLAAGPLVRSVLVRLGPEDHVFCLLVHHIVIDGWSTDIVLNEMWLGYDAARAGRGPDLPELPVGYGDYAAWQHDWLTGADADTGLRYWQDRLADVPPLALPTDRPYPPAQTMTGATVTFRFDAALTAGLRRVARQYRATEFMALMAGFQAVLGWYAGQSDFGVGSQVAGRDRAGTEGMVGLLVNTVVFRADLGGDPSYAALLGRVRDAAVTAYAHQLLPFEHVVSTLNVTRDVRRPPVFQVNLAMLNWDHAGRSRHGGLLVTAFPVDNPVTRHELACYIRPDDAGLAGHITYNTDLFDRETVAGLADRFRALLTAAVAEPDRRLSEIDLLGAADRARLAAWSDGGALAPSAPTLPDLIRPWTVRTPDAPAVVYGTRTLSYAELAAAAQQLAAHLRRLGAGPDVRVGICLDHAPALAVAVLAAVTAGAGYLPLDPEAPPARLEFLLSDSGAPVLVTEAGLRDRFTGFAGEIVIVDDSGAPIGCVDDSEAEVGCVDAGEAAVGCVDAVEAVAEEDPAGAALPDRVAAPDDLAYVIYTSGSTGRPKGVAVAHRQLVRYLDGVRERLRIAPGGRFGLMQSMSFDFSVTMFWLALSTGGVVHLLPRRVAGRDLAAYLARTGIDYLKLTPSHLAALAGDVDDVAALLPRRALLLGGEGSRLDWARDLARRGRIAVINHYGPTETTVGVTTFEIPPGGDVPAEVAGSSGTPIGRPLPNARVYLLDQRLRPVPPGAVGEVCIGGDRLARGYLGRPELTAQRFLPDPFGPPGSRLYRTGDLGRWLPSGDLEFLGRRDDQVKLRGYRIEPGEVATALAALPGVGQAVVVVRDERLVAYLERAAGPALSDADPNADSNASVGTAGGADPDIAEIRRCLAPTLPEYLLPAQVVWLDRLPLLAHGKVDRQALPEPVVTPSGGDGGSSAPDGPVQCAIAEVWAQVLRLPQVGADDDFFDLGGHSLLATQVVSRLRQALPAGTRPVTVMDLFKHPTVRRLAEHAERAGPASGELLHELTPSVDPALHVLSLVCVPYGGATAIVYQPLADALPSGHSLFAVAPPGRDLPTAEADRSVEEVAAACVAEILDRVPGPLVVYGHCGPGGALAVEIARRLEAVGRPLAAVYLGGVFPFARPTGALGRLARTLRMERLRSDTVYANWLQSMGADVGALEPDERRHLIGAMRRDAEFAEDYFTRLFDQGAARLRAPVVSIVGERDPGTEYYQERFREWAFLADHTALVVIDEAGHYFLKYRAPELAEIVTGTHHRLAVAPTAGTAVAPAAGTAVDAGTDPNPDAALVGLAGPADGTGTWRLGGVQHGDAGSEPAGPRPSMARFLTVALSQLVANTGAALTTFAIPLWIYLRSDSLLRFALFSVVATLPGILAGPVAGALVDRGDRRRTLIAATVAASALQGSLALLVWNDTVPAGLLYGLLALLSVAVAVQRLAYLSAVPQLVPKRYLGNANGVVQLATGAANFLVPLLAVGLLAAIGLAGILVVEVACYAVALLVLGFTRFPATMAWRRRESVGQEILGGFRYFWSRLGLRAMLMFFVVINIFLAMVVVLLSPLVLTVGTLTDAGRVATIATAGALAGGLLVAVWGGPRRYRMRGMLISTAGYGVSALVVALRPDLGVIAAGAVGMSFFLVVQNGIWMTIIHTKVPQRFHARVIALNQMVAQSVVSVGFIAAPMLSEVLGSLIRPGGALSAILGPVLGVGPGRGIALVYAVCGIVMATVSLGALRRTRLATFDRTVPDAEPDDLVGLAALAERGQPGR